MDRGPWQVIEPDEGKRDWAVGSDDFTHDVWLYVTGDFADDAQRRQYCEWLAGALNMAAASTVDSNKYVTLPAPRSTPATP